MSSTPRADVPSAVRIAALLFAAYGLMLMAQALLLQSAAGWEQANDFPRALLRLAGCGLIAYALMQGLRWGWWAAVLLGGLWTVTGAAAVLMLTAGDGWSRLPAGAPVFLVAFVAILGTAMALLLQPGSRAAFR